MTALQAKNWLYTATLVVCLTLNAVQGLTVRHEQSENKGYTRMHLMRRSYSNSNGRGGSAPERVERDNINDEKFPPYFDTDEGAGIRDDEVYIVRPDRYHKRYYLKHEDDFKRDSFDQFGAVTSPREHNVKEGSKYSASISPREYQAKDEVGYAAGAHPREYHPKEENHFSSVSHPREYTSKEKSNFGALYSSGITGSSGESSSHEESSYGGHTNKKENGNFGGYFNSREGVSWSSAKDGGRGGGGYGGSGYGGSGSGNYGDSGSSASGGYSGSSSSGDSGPGGYGKGASSNYGGSHGKSSGYSSGSSGYSGSAYAASSPSVGSHKGSTSYISGLGGNFGGNGGVNSHGSRGEVKGLLQAKYIPPSGKKEKTEVHGYHGSDHDDGHEDEHGNDGYEFEYFVHDPHTHDMKTQKEHSDGHTVKGQYTIVQPDGLLRTVDYTADWKNGFQAKVHYSPAPKVDEHEEHAYSAANFNIYNKGHH